MKRKGGRGGEHKFSPRRVAGKLREMQAVALRVQGESFTEIANRLKYADRATAYNAIKYVLRSFPREDVAELREIENARLDRALIRAWGIMDDPEAKPCDANQAVSSVVRISKRRSELNGLDAPTRAPVDEYGRTVQPTINVIYESADQHPPAETP